MHPNEQENPYFDLLSKHLINNAPLPGEFPPEDHTGITMVLQALAAIGRIYRDITREPKYKKILEEATKISEQHFYDSLLGDKSTQDILL